MADYGMTPQGFVPKRLAEIQDDINTSLQIIQDPVTGETPFQNVTDDTVLQQIVGVFSEALSECWNAAYQASIQFDPLKNTGAGQSGTVQLNAILRKPGSPAILQMQMSGDVGTGIPEGSIVASADGTQEFSTLADCVIGSNGTGLVQAQETIASGTTPALNTVVRIITILPGGGWTGATNIATISESQTAETDEQLRARQQRSTALTSYRLIEAIYAAAMNVPGVIYARAYQNASTYPVDSRGIPYKEVALVVEGGADNDVANALFLRLPTGQIGFGTTTVPLTDIQGLVYPISFSRPNDLLIYISLTITLVDRNVFPDDYANQIANNIVQFAEYGGEGLSDGFPPGTNVVYTRLYTPINWVPGFSIVSMYIGTSANPTGTSNIAVAWNQVARFDVSRITVKLQ